MGVPVLSAAELRTVAAFAEVLNPPYRELPGAEIEVAVARRLDEMLSHGPSRQVRLIRAAIRAFDHLSFPRRFSRLDAATRSRLVASWLGSRNPAKRELSMLLKTLAAVQYVRDPRVLARSGSRLECRTASGVQPAPSTVAIASPQASGEIADLIVIGSGAGGAPTAAILAEAGLEVIVVEAGPYLLASAYPDDPVEAMGLMYRDGGLTVAEGVPPVPIPTGRVLGGTTVINSGTCFRAPAEVLASWPGPRGHDWEAALAPEYEEAERLLAVRALEPEWIGKNGDLVALGAARLGYAGAPLARNADDCNRCSSCFAGCRLDAKRGMHVTYLPRAAAAGARIHSGVEARRLIIENGRVVGVECVYRDGERPARRLRFDARKAVILSGGALGTPELLLRSGLTHPMIGRGLRIQPASGVGARFAEPVRGWEGVMQSYAVEQWADRGIVLEATFTPLAMGAQWLAGSGPEFQQGLLDYERIATNGIQLRDLYSGGRVRVARNGALRIAYRFHRREAAKMQFAIARAAEIWFAAGAEQVFAAVAGIGSLRASQIADFETRSIGPERFRIEGFHPLASARFDTDPGRGVADWRGAAHEVAGLYLADGSIIPGAPGVNPMMTIIALCSHNARRLVEQLG